MNVGEASMPVLPVHYHRALILFTVMRWQLEMGRAPGED